jgi:NADH:ubiquinone oxidoreductase subunit F (NADH-binding)
LSELLKRAENGRAYPEDIEEIQHLGEHILATARCPLGKSAVTPALTLVKNFPEVLA